MGTTMSQIEIVIGSTKTIDMTEEFNKRENVESEEDFNDYVSDMKTIKINNMKSEEFLNSMDEWDTVFDPNGKQEYTEAQLLRFAELYLSHHLDCNDYVRDKIEEAEKSGFVEPETKQMDVTKKDPYGGNTRTGGLSPDTGPRN